MLRLAACALILALALPARAATLGERVEALVRPLIDQGWVPSACVGVIHDGRTEVFSFGHVKPGGAAPDADTIYEIGSVTKTMTAILAAEQWLAGDFTLESPVSPLIGGAKLPEFGGRAITVEDLLTHHSGLPTAPPELLGVPLSGYGEYSAEKMLASLAQFPLTRPPGTKFEYSNQGFALLGHLLAHRTGSSYPQLLAARLFAPLGMRDSAVSLPDAQTFRLTPGFDADGNATEPFEPLVYDACGAVRSSVGDMLRYVQAQIEPPATPLGRAMEAAHAPRRGTDLTGMRIGLGWLVADDGTVWHNGQTEGYHSYVAFRRNSKIGVVVLTNAATFHVDVLGDAVLSMLASEPYDALQLPPDLPIASPADYAGRYQLPDGDVLGIRAAGDRLELVVGERTFRLHRSAGDDFYLRNGALRMVFTRTDGRVTGFVLHVSQGQVSGTRLADELPGRAHGRPR